MNHFTQVQLHSLLGGALPPDERAVLLEHALDCDACAALLWQANQALPAVNPPAGMQARILERTRGEPQPESLRSYALRVFAAMAAALVLLFSGAFQKLARLDLPQLSQDIRAQVTIFIDSTKEELHLASTPE